MSLKLFNPLRPGVPRKMDVANIVDPHQMHRIGVYTVALTTKVLVKLKNKIDRTILLNDK